MREKNVNLDIALTHITTRKRQTLTAALGVALGIAIFLFMNSLSSGFTNYSRSEIFKNNAHIKIYKADEISQSKSTDTNQLSIVVNPHILNESKTIINPYKLIERLRQESYVTKVLPQVNVDVFYYNGNSQLRGTANGVNILDADAMFKIEDYICAGNLKDLYNNPNAIIIGKGIADKLNLRLEDQIKLTSGDGVSKFLKIKAILCIGNSIVDQSKSYINITSAQQLVKQTPSYITTIYANITDADKAIIYAKQLQQLTEYTVEPWQITNADMLSGDKVRSAMMSAISFSILIVAGFGIYNILNMTVMQKINDIAILKAMGFSGGDVIMIFVIESVIMGLIGVVIGLTIGAILIQIMSGIYMGPPVGYFPIRLEARLFMISSCLGIVVTFFAGYIPARKAANLDPVEILRR